MDGIITDKLLQSDIVFQDYMSINSKMLRFMGLTIDTNGNKRDKRSKILERVPTIITNIISLVDTFFQMQWIVDLWVHDKDLVMQITTSGISNIVCICKVFTDYATVDVSMNDLETFS